VNAAHLLMWVAFAVVLTTGLLWALLLFLMSDLDSRWDEEDPPEE
jgi:hypothetical protein